MCGLLGEIPWLLPHIFPMKSYVSCPLGFWLSRMVAILAFCLGCSTLQAQFGPPGGGGQSYL